MQTSGSLIVVIHEDSRLGLMDFIRGTKHHLLLNGGKELGERFIGTLRRECLDHVIALNEGHLLRVVGEYLDYYHAARPHQGLGRDSPEGRKVESGPGLIIAEPMVGGLHHRYRRAA